MTTCVSVWRQPTGLSKIEFAERSGIRRVNIDRSSLHARTLDKYLLIETLPRNTGWREVVQTADFVLAEIDQLVAVLSFSTERADIAYRLEVLRECVRNSILSRSGGRV